MSDKSLDNVEHRVFYIVGDGTAFHDKAEAVQHANLLLREKLFRGELEDSAIPIRVVEKWERELSVLWVSPPKPVVVERTISD